MALKLRVKQIKSGINRPATHKTLLKGLGLTRMNKVVILNDTPAIRGMIRKIPHLVSVEPAE
jgi:large subunit ribosomal protein L30